MAQGVFPYKYEKEKTASGMTSLAGLPVYLDPASVLNPGESISTHLHVKVQGWTDEQMVMSLVLLNLAGGDCVEDLAVLEGDEGFYRVLREIEHWGRTGSEKRSLRRRWRKQRMPHTAFIPAAKRPLDGLVRANADFVAEVQRRTPAKTATLDMDATLVETHKKEALYCYKKHKAYQPLNIYWAEQCVVVLSEFRDGNVSANFDLLRPLQRALAMIPGGVGKVCLRSDAAGYQAELLAYCAEAKSERFGVIEFAVGVDVTAEFKKAVREVAEADWRPLPGKVRGRVQEYAEICFVPRLVGHKKNGPVYRYLGIREPLEQQTLPGMDEQLRFPFQTMDWGAVKYKVTGVVTNRDMAGDEVIRWYRERCGKSEEAHSIMKEDLAGGKLPSGLFGSNAAWWQIMILAFNLNVAMKRLVLGGDWVSRRMKAIRFWLINVPGRMLTHARSLVVRLVGGHPSNEVLLEARRRMVILWESG